MARRSRARAPLVAALAVALLGGCRDADERKGLWQHTSQELGLSFAYPPRFVVGRYGELEMPEIERAPDAPADLLESPFKNAVVLVEPDAFAGQNRYSIAVGSVPAITLERRSGSRASFLRSAFFREEFERRIGDRAVYQLPGYPGPFGDQAYYYLVPLDGGDLLEIVAHRYYFDRPNRGDSDTPPETRYDRIAETIIETLDEE